MKRKVSNTTVNIKVQDIHQHPDNPRKNLGDLTELVESVKKKGIMQNLTVIPGHWSEDKTWHDSGYTLIIGHRRFAAAKQAGITELPCRIVEGMEKKEQVSVMLEENMQRADLTILEQANGFQMMLDLGDTEEQIAEKSGFSKTTVRHRLNIAKLDQELLKEKESDDSFQLSLKDLYELEKVADIDVRNKILKESRSSRDIVWKSQNAVTEASRDKVEKALIEMFEASDIKKAPDKVKYELYTGKWETVKEYSLDKDAPKSLRIPKKEKAELFYIRSYSNIRVIKLAPKRKETAEDKVRKENDRKKKQIKEIMKEMNIRKHEFISSVISGKIAPLKEESEIQEEIWNILVKIGSYICNSNLRSFFTGKADYECSLEEKEEADRKVTELSVLFQMMIELSYGLEHAGDVYDYQLHYNAECCGIIKKAYAVLERYGWSFTEEEHEILNGTHEFYVPEKKEEGGEQ